MTDSWLINRNNISPKRVEYIFGMPRGNNCQPRIVDPVKTSFGMANKDIFAENQKQSLLVAVITGDFKRYISRRRKTIPEGKSEMWERIVWKENS